MSTSIEKPKTGRPRLGDKKKVKVSTNIPPELLKALEDDVKSGKGSSVSSIIYLLLRKHYNI